ncbi:MAG: hypothetical protein IJE40_00105 [Clostridia bacterium]|nr:hypothetical protein [Clostridia bacterium]
MDHLTVDEIMDFVSITEINEETMQLTAKVNSHIRNCKECLKLVQSYQEIYDEFLRVLTEDDMEMIEAEDDNEVEGYR